MSDLVRRRERLRRGWVTAGEVWLWLGVALALLDDRFLWAPLDAALPVVVYLGSAWVCAGYWRLRQDRLGHQVLRAAVPLSLAHRHRFPEQWRDCLVPGSLVVTETGWHWRPTATSGSELVPVSWAANEVASVSWNPAWRPLLPRIGYVHLALRSGTSVDLMVWEPERLGWFTIGVPRPLSMS